MADDRLVCDWLVRGWWSAFLWLVGNWLMISLSKISWLVAADHPFYFPEFEKSITVLHHKHLQPLLLAFTKYSPILSPDTSICLNQSSLHFDNLCKILKIDANHKIKQKQYIYISLLLLMFRYRHSQEGNTHWSTVSILIGTPWVIYWPVLAQIQPKTLIIWFDHKKKGH